jgi:hypothetical protein
MRHRVRGLDREAGNGDRDDGEIPDGLLLPPPPIPDDMLQV